MTHKYNRIIYKLHKYKLKYNSTNILNKQQYYMQKMNYYNQYLHYQHGGLINEKDELIESLEGLPAFINKERNKFNDNIGETIKDITEIVKRTAKIDDQTIDGLTKGITTIKDNYDNIKQQLIGSTVEFAKYNTNVRDSFDKIAALIKRLKPLDDKIIQLIMKIIKEMSNIDFVGMEWNQELIMELGLLMSDHTDASMNETLDRIDDLFNKQGKILIYKDVVNFFNNVVKSRIDRTIYNIETLNRFDELSKKIR